MTPQTDLERSRSAATAASFPHRARGPLAITHVNVITMESRELLADRTVVIEEGSIRTIAPSAALDVAGMQLVDGSNRYLMPGLADMHTHVFNAGVFDLYLANGVTQLRNMLGLPLHLALAQKVERGALPGPRLFSASPLIDGLGAQGLTAWPRSLVLTDPAQAEAMVQQLVARGYGEIKAYQWLTLDALRALGSAAARSGVRMAGHCPDGITFEQSIDAGMGCFEHFTGIAAGHLLGGRQFPSLRDSASRLGTRESLELIAHHLDFDAIRRLAHTMAAKDIWNCPTLVIWQQQNPELAAALADPDLQYEHPSVVRDWERLIKNRYAALPCATEEWLSLAQSRDVALAKVVAVLHEEGAPLLLGTDAPDPFVIHGCSIHQELANLVRAGLTPYEALRCGTVEAARFLGKSATSGSVAVGKQADLLLLRANPLMDVGAARALESVFVNGYYLSRADLDGLLARHSASLAAPAPIELPKVVDAGEGKIERQRVLQERIGETHIGRANYRHGKLADGGWQVEEHSARSGPRGPQRCRTRLWLGPDWTVRRAEIEAETDVGRERSEISWSEGAYRARITQPDGFISDSVLTSMPLLPSERLAFSVLPEWLASRTAPVAPHRYEVASLSIEHEAVQVAAMTAEPSPADATPAGKTNGMSWRVSVARPGELTTQTYRISNDGTLLGLYDALFGAARELIAEPAEDRSAPHQRASMQERN